jgi:hypothetical protein
MPSVSIARVAICSNWIIDRKKGAHDGNAEVPSKPD